MFTDITTIAAGRNDDLLRFADAVVDFTAAGGTIDELRTVVNDAVKPTPKPARKAQAHDPQAGTGAIARKATWQMSKAERRARYAGNREFWAGPATDAQIERVGTDAFEGMLAFEAAELHASHGAKANGKRFFMLRRGDKK